MKSPAPERSVGGWPVMGANPETRDLAIPAAPGAHHGIPRGLRLSSRANAQISEVRRMVFLGYLQLTAEHGQVIPLADMVHDVAASL
jgi:hypothetical protein